MKKYTKKKIVTVLLQYLAIAVFVVVDLLIKNVVVDKIALYEDVKFIDGVLGWTYVQNTGMAWSLFDGNPQLLSLITGIIIAGFLVFLALPLKRPLMYDICIPLILAGGMGNMIDRITRGFVVDYIKTLYVDFPIYNFADCLVCIGAFVLIFYLIYEIIRDEKKAKSEKLKGENRG